MTKNADAFRTISEVADDLDLPQHVLRFWETRFPQIKPLKRAGGRRFYRPGDIQLLSTIRRLLYAEGYTIKGVQRLLREQGPKALQNGSRPNEDGASLAAHERVPAEVGQPDGDGAAPLPPRGHGRPELGEGEGKDLIEALDLIRACEAILKAARSADHAVPAFAGDPPVPSAPAS